MAKSFKDAIAGGNNPALAFLTTDATPKAKGKKQPGAKQPKAQPQQAGEKRTPRPKRETKTVHVHLLMKPSLHAAGVEAAEIEGVSFSTLLTELLEKYLDEQEG